MMRRRRALVIALAGTLSAGRAKAAAALGEENIRIAQLQSRELLDLQQQLQATREDLMAARNIIEVHAAGESQLHDMIQKGEYIACGEVEKIRSALNEQHKSDLCAIEVCFRVMF